MFTTFSSLESRTSTVDLRVDYLRPGKPQDLLCDATVQRIGNRVAATHMVVHQGTDYIAAECRGVYNVVRPHGD